MENSKFLQKLNNLKINVEILLKNYHEILTIKSKKKWFFKKILEPS